MARRWKILNWFSHNWSLPEALQYLVLQRGEVNPPKIDWKYFGKNWSKTFCFQFFKNLIPSYLVFAALFHSTWDGWFLLKLFLQDLLISIKDNVAGKYVLKVRNKNSRLTHIRAKFYSHRNQSNSLHCKSIGCFLYECDGRQI